MRCEPYGPRSNLVMRASIQKYLRDPGKDFRARFEALPVASTTFHQPPLRGVTERRWHRATGDGPRILAEGVLALGILCRHAVGSPGSKPAAAHPPKRRLVPGDRR